MKKRNIALGIAGAVGAAVAVKMLTRDSTIDWQTVKDDVPHSDRSRFINVDGARVHYQEFGDPRDPTVILIHGYTASVYVWHLASPSIADEGFHVIAVDLLGYGYSEKPAWFEYTIGAQARMVSRLMDRLGQGRASLVGSSYGGAVAATIALDYPQRVEKLVLVDAVINDEPKAHPILKLVRVPLLGEALTPFLADSRLLLKHRMHKTLAPINHHLITSERMENIMRPLGAADGHNSLLQTSRNWHADRIERDAHLIRQPTLIVWGEQDTVIPIESGAKLQDSIPDSRLVLIKDCGHVPQEERPEIFSRLVADFCRDRAEELESLEDELELEV